MRPVAQMNAIPFIDSMLVLLAVLLTTATFFAQGKIPVVLPRAAQTEPVANESAMDITIDAAGQLYLGEDASGLDGLSERLCVVMAVAESPGHRRLDQAALKTLGCVSSFRPILDALRRDNWPIRVPIEFLLRG